LKRYDSHPASPREPRLPLGGAFAFGEASAGEASGIYASGHCAYGASQYCVNQRLPNRRLLVPLQLPPSPMMLLGVRVELLHLMTVDGLPRRHARLEQPGNLALRGIGQQLRGDSDCRHLVC
jgi:hypothetical protein